MTNTGKTGLRGILVGKLIAALLICAPMTGVAEDLHEPAPTGPANRVATTGPYGGLDSLTGGGPSVSLILGGFERSAMRDVISEKVPSAMPSNGTQITSGFGYRRGRMHRGIDFAGRHGSEIYATADGVVTFAGWQRGYGKVVKIRHAFGFDTVYAHLSKIRVSAGESVARGVQIGDMGSTGRSTGTHLHYEVRVNGAAVNPAKFIEAARHVF